MGAQHSGEVVQGTVRWEEISGEAKGVGDVTHLVECMPAPGFDPGTR